MEHTVGEILYLLLNKDKRVIPVRVVEQIVRKSIDGEETSYVVELPNDDRKRISLKKVNGSVYKSYSEVRSVMIKNATSVIDQIIDSAKSVSIEVFGDKGLNEDLQIEDSQGIDDKKDDNEDVHIIDLGNGLKGRISASQIT